MEREGEGEGQKDRHILELQPIRTEDCNIRKVVQDNRHTEMTTWHHANVCFVYTSLVQKKKNCFILSWFRHWRILCKIQTRFLGLKARIDTECLICLAYSWLQMQFVFMFSNGSLHFSFSLKLEQINWSMNDSRNEMRKLFWFSCHRLIRKVKCFTCTNSSNLILLWSLQIKINTELPFLHDNRCLRKKGYLEQLSLKVKSCYCFA